jgi:hypothetical protein
MMAVEVRTESGLGPVFHVSSSKRMHARTRYTTMVLRRRPETLQSTSRERAPTPITAIVDWPALLPRR